jgi:WD40 repeat protein
MQTFCHFCCYVSLLCSQDKEVRLWDVRTPQCQAVLTCPCQATVAYDQQGLVFAVGLDNGLIKLFDAGNYEQGPFETFTVRTSHTCTANEPEKFLVGTGWPGGFKQMPLCTRMCGNG